MYASCTGRKPREKERKKGGRLTKIKAVKKKAHSLRNRRQSRDRRSIWTFKDTLAGQTDRLKAISETLCSVCFILHKISHGWGFYHIL